MTSVRILLVDDHALMREMLSVHLAQEPSFDIVGTAANAGEAIELAIERRPNVVVMDIDMPGLSCFDAARRIAAAQPEVRFVFLSAYTHDRYIEQALAVGALGYVAKTEPPDKIVAAIRAVADKKAYFSEEVQARIVLDADRPRLAPRGKSRMSTLTPRELEVLQYVSRGLAKKEIAGMMNISLKTVEKHSDNLMRKLSVHDRVELTRLAIREGLVEP